MIVGVVLLVVAIGAVAVVLGTRGGKSSKITMEYSVTLRLRSDNDISCRGDHGGYNDITNGAEVEVTDGKGTLLGVGDLLLDGTSSTGIECVYRSSFPIKTSSDGFYRATSGNANRGYLTHPASEVSDGKLTVDAVLGDPT